MADPAPTDARVLSRRGLGLTGDLPAGMVRQIARAAEDAGYATLWVNDDPGGEGLLALRAAAEATSTIGLAVGLMPLDRWSPRRIATRIAELRLPVERLTVGIGSGAEPGGLTRVRQGVEALRTLADARIVVGALGPKMCRLAGEVADGVLLDWPTPSHALACADLAGRAAAACGRRRPDVAGYVFTALGAAAQEQLCADAAHYAAVPAYAAHFRRMGVEPADASVAGETEADIQAGLRAYATALDETVVRACTGDDTAASYVRLLGVAAPTTA